jgi:acyl carrier protein
MIGSALRAQVVESIQIALPKVLGRAADDAVPELSEHTLQMEDLGLTSVATLELVLELEESMDIQIDVEEIGTDDVASIGALADYVARHAVAAS